MTTLPASRDAMYPGYELFEFPMPDLQQVGPKLWLLKGRINITVDALHMPIFIDPAQYLAETNHLPLTDLGTVPWWARRLVPATYGRGVLGYIVHDYLLNYKKMRRATADDVAREIWVMCGVAQWRLKLMSFGIRIGSLAEVFRRKA